MLVSLAVTATGVLVRGPLAVPQLLHQLVVLVAQYPREEQRGLVRAPGFKSPPRPAFAVDGNVPLALHASSPSAAAAAAAAPWQKWLLCGMMAGCVGVVSQFVNSLHKLAFCVEHLLVGREWRRLRLSCSLSVCFVDGQWNRFSVKSPQPAQFSYLQSHLFRLRSKGENKNEYPPRRTAGLYHSWPDIFQRRAPL